MGAAEIFNSTRFARYHAEIQVRERLVGGIPKDADTIKQWLKARLELDDRAIIELAEETEQAMVDDSGTRPSADALLDALAAKSGGNGFKRVDGQLVYEGRCMKAALKEGANVAFPGTSWPGKPSGIRKGLMRYLAERVFVEEDSIPLGVTAPTHEGVERIKHIITPQGPRSAINIVDLIEKPHLAFTVRVFDDCLHHEVWAGIWEALEDIGIGADRARSDGKFDLTCWERL
jgi:hypothetical protein